VSTQADQTYICHGFWISHIFVLLQNCMQISDFLLQVSMVSSMVAK